MTLQTVKQINSINLSTLDEKSDTIEITPLYTAFALNITRIIYDSITNYKLCAK